MMDNVCKAFNIFDPHNSLMGWLMFSPFTYGKIKVQKQITFSKSSFKRLNGSLNIGSLLLEPMLITFKPHFIAYDLQICL